MRLIDVDPLRKKLCEFIEKTESELFLRSLGTFVRLLDLTPTADAVQVVRCKDCKWWEEWANGTGTCEKFADATNRTLALGTDSTDYCSFAERKDDE